MKASNVRAAMVLMLTACGCAGIAGFEDLSPDCPTSTPECADAGTGASGNAGSSGSAGTAVSGGNGGNAANAGAAGTGAGGSAASAGTAACSGSAPAQAGRGPTMAKIQRPDQTCFWIDTTEVTEEEFTEYLATNPAPSNDSVCPGPPDEPLSPCKGRGLDGGSLDPRLPKTCVDWCAARDFCRWAGKTLCHDNFGAIGPDQLLSQSDYFAACTQGGTKLSPFHEDCGSQVCNVDQQVPLPAGGINECFTLAADGATRVYDLIGNVEEWTDSCFAQTEETDCAIRGSYFRSGREHECCEQLSRLSRRQATPTVGFRCCDYP